MFFKTRSGLTEADGRFIADTLGDTPGDREEIVNALADPWARTTLLHDGRLFERSMTPPPVFLDISPQLFFYVFIYRALSRKRLADDDVVDYVADVCVEFRSSAPLLQLSEPRGGFYYVTDLLNLMDGLDGTHRHILRKYIGNITLFLTGFFPGYFVARTLRRGAPPIGFYEGIAREQYSSAAGDPDAKDDDTAGVLETLSERFCDVREALNDLSGEYALVGGGRGPSTSSP
jgi:hypothetical protein